MANKAPLVYPDAGQAVAFHKALAARLGTAATGPIDERSVQAVLDRMSAIVRDGEGDIFWIAAEFLFDTIRNRPFGNGSEQTAVALTFALLYRNGILVIPPEEEEIRGVVLAIGDGAVYVAMVEEWLRQCARPLPSLWKRSS